MTIKAYLFSTNVSGLQHSADYAAHMPRIRSGDRVTLVAQLDNIHDPEAIQVHFEGKHIGWIPAKLGPFKGMLHRLLAAGFNEHCIIDRHDTDAKVYERMNISIWLVVV